MPFIRHSRDKRGYERTFVMHAYRAGQGGQQTKVLYLFRSPASLKVGRKPLDAEVVEALEHTHPDLNFDWTVLRRDSVRQDERERPGRGGGGGGSRRGVQRPPAGRRKAAAAERPEPTMPTMEDESLLGQVLGAREADRLRREYADLLQRILRRARTPEERDRLTGRAGRLNPDEWPDEAAVRAGAQSAEAEWAAIAAELPTRRRGRRGGRRREGPDGPSASGIMAEGRELDGESTPDTLADVDRATDGGGNRGGLGSDPGEATGPADDVQGDG